MTETQKDALAALARHPLLQGLPSEYLDVLAQHANHHNFSSGEIIFPQDAPAEHFYLIQHGEVSVEIPAIYGPPITVQTLGDGDLLGWSWLIPPYTWHFEARAMADTQTLEFDGERLRARCESEPEMGYALLKRFAELMTERVQAARLRVLEVCGPAEAV